MPASEGPVVDLPTDDEDPLDDQLRREAREAVERGIAELPHHYRMALVLKDIVELPVADVAGILGLKRATVKTRVHRARLHLRRILTESLPRRDAPPPHYSQRVCLDLLHAKQEALDRGVPFRVPQQEVCERCEALFTTLDLARDSCAAIGRGQLPPPLRERLLEELRER
jgi:predicted RNA polymerase sigma factor